MRIVELAQPRIEKQNQKIAVALPKEFNVFLHEYPELHKLLRGFAERDPGTFIHSVTVYLTGVQLIRDLFLRYHYSAKQRQRILQNLPFFLLHDIGKTATHTDAQVAQKRVHPAKGAIRTQEEMALHWVHPQLSATLIEIWGHTSGDANQLKMAKQWAKLTLIHDELLNPYLSHNPQALENAHISDQISQLPFPDFFTMLVFLVSDTTVAMGLPRPNRPGTWQKEKIIQVLHSILSKNERVNKLVPNGNKSSFETKRIKHFVVVSVLSSLKRMQSLFSDEQMMMPTEFHTRHFHTNSADQSGAATQLEKLVQLAWKEAEPEWLKTVEKMEKNGVFRFV